MLLRKHGRYTMRRKVPARFRSIEPRTSITMALKTEDLREAEYRADLAWQSLLAGWESLLVDEDEDSASAHFDRARLDAQRLGIRYAPAVEVAQMPIADILSRAKLAGDAQRRSERAQDEGRAASTAEAKAKARGDSAAAERAGEAALKAKVDVDHARADITAALGLADVPEILLSSVVDEAERLAADKLAGQTDRQLSLWRNPRRRAITQLIELVGDKPLPELSRVDLLNFRDFQIRLANTGSISMGSARKALKILLAVLRAVASAYEIEIPTQGIVITDRAPARPPKPLPAEWITDKLLAPGALNGLNDEARWLLLMSINTGARPSETAGLKVGHVDLTSNIPVAHIRPEGRQLKNANSNRSVPLVGVSLDAARDALGAASKAGRGPDDWLLPRYAGKDASAAVNKYLRANGLLPDGCSLYSLRHGFQDRLDRAGVQERVCRDLMGHALQDRERYGDGGGDETRLAAVEKVAL